jgi:hypothetical protein
VTMATAWVKAESESLRPASGWTTEQLHGRALDAARNAVDAAVAGTAVALTQAAAQVCAPLRLAVAPRAPPVPGHHPAPVPPTQAPALAQHFPASAPRRSH